MTSVCEPALAPMDAGAVGRREAYFTNVFNIDTRLA
jgi:hypothetical protein